MSRPSPHGRVYGVSLGVPPCRRDSDGPYLEESPASCTSRAILFCVELLPEFHGVGFVIAFRGDQYGEIECFHVSDGQFADIVNSPITFINFSHFNLAGLPGQVASGCSDLCPGGISALLQKLIY